MRLQPPGSDLCSPSSLHLEDFLFYSYCSCFSATYYGFYLSRTWITRTTSQLMLTCPGFLPKHRYSSRERGEIESCYFIMHWWHWSLDSPRRWGKVLAWLWKLVGVGVRKELLPAHCSLHPISLLLSHRPFKKPNWKHARTELQHYRNLLFQENSWRWWSLESMMAVKIWKCSFSGKSCWESEWPCKVSKQGSSEGVTEPWSEVLSI